MCESKVIVLAEGARSVEMEAAAQIMMMDGSVLCRDITGAEILLKNVRLKEINLMSHEVIFERRVEQPWA